MNLVKTATSYTIDEDRIRKGDNVSFTFDTTPHSNNILYGVVIGVTSSHIAIHNDDNATTYRLQIDRLVKGDVEIIDVWQNVQFNEEELDMVLLALESQIIRLNGFIQEDLNQGDGVGQKLAENQAITQKLFKDLYVMKK